ncbi:MAG TPA: hypothetical protein DEP57_08615 [Selenomonas sp.]|nr:hypothetical protein [Selenomonas sp.]
MTKSKPMTAEEKIRQLSTWLAERLTDWEVVYANGSSDFTVTTGVKLNQIRSQILLLRRDIRLLCDANHLDYPTVAYEQVPPPVAETYVAKQYIGSHREILYDCVAEAGKPKQICLF